ncbi:uncharacterized protein FFB20_04425 [Fusarium fujikuroi]|nr:uncharacterized protein FFB20_04425 [Fusarium fujikuroi]SCN91144.1 uncharacterized protein FFC1_06267 [Fusarium fujikuroi]SCN96229.1 uncharacterized protein FFM5_06352 [Fusarium fujikuroi]SCO01716.1 uncharacterized protein FFE2_09832 [Fusarium fujikuroi]SCO37935.1 uncharacterized protein FFNC_05945 [Fusarium fujikuroi]
MPSEGHEHGDLPCGTALLKPMYCTHLSRSVWRNVASSVVRIAPPLQTHLKPSQKVWGMRGTNEEHSHGDDRPALSGGMHTVFERST